MLPTILQIGPITISSLGVAIVLGFFLGSFLVWKKEKEENFNEEKIMDAILLVSIISLVCSRTWYILFYWDKIGRNLSSWFDFVGKPGFSWPGAFLGGALTLRFLCKKNKWDFFKVADFSSFGIALGSIFASLGMFLDGNFYAIYEAIFMVVILRLLYYFDKYYRTYEWYKNKRGEAAPGFLFLVFLILFSFTKLVVAFLKEHDLYWRWSQFINLLIILISGAILYWRSGRNLKSIMSLLPETNRKRRVKKRFHFKTGMEAKK